MKREVLVTRLTARAKTRYGVRVSDEIFGEWLRKKLIQSPPKRGRIREWDKRHYRIVLEICRLSAEGIRFSGIIKWHLWIKGFSPPGFQPTAERKHLLKEFRRLRKSLTQPIYSTYDPRSGETISDDRANRIAKSMGTQDERLRIILPLELTETFDSRNLVQFGVGGEKLADLVSSKARKLLEHTTQITDPALINEFSSAMASAGIASLLGLWGDPDEIGGSGEHSIQIANNDAFEFARSALAWGPKAISLWAESDQANRDGSQAATKSLTRADWRISIFVGFLHLAVEQSTVIRN